MKKLLSIILAVIMVLCLTVPAFAAPTSMTENPVGSGEYESNDYGDGSNLEVPVTGQINRAEKLIKITTDISNVYWWIPSGADQGSAWDNTLNGYNDVTALAEGGYSTTAAGTVYAPTYSITNTSGFGVDVSLYSFTTSSTDSYGALSLNLIWNGGSPVAVVTGGTDVSFSTAHALGTLADTATATYTFGGSWAGTYQTTEIGYTQAMVLNFKAA